MEKYEKPEVEFIVFEVEDVITTSGAGLSLSTPDDGTNTWGLLQ